MATLPDEIPTDVLAILNGARKRKLTGGAYSFELAQGQQDKQGTLKTYFDSIGASLAGRFGQVSPTVAKWLSSNGVDLNRNCIDMSRKWD